MNSSSADFHKSGGSASAAESEFDEEEAKLQLKAPLVLDSGESSFNESPSGFESRGVSIKLLRAVRDFVKARQATQSCDQSEVGYWSIARVSALILGNHEILPKGDVGRWGDNIDIETTLTYKDRCSLIKVLRRRHRDSNNRHPELNLSYEEDTAEATVFVSFAYQDSFLELVESIELFMSRNDEYSENATYFWVDMFVNNQWVAQDRPFEWWKTTFRLAVERIGNTLCFLSQWSNPNLLTRAWCLFEISCSQRLSVLLNKEQLLKFQETLQLGSSEAIISRLCIIDCNNATSHVPEDREKIFSVVEEMEGGFREFNIKVVNLIREWVLSSVLSPMISELENSSVSEEVGGQNSTSNDVFGMSNSARLLKDLGKYDEAEILFKKLLVDRERALGNKHPNTLITVCNLAGLLRKRGNFKQAEELYRRALGEYEKTLGPDNHSRIITCGNLANLLGDYGRHEEAEYLCSGALEACQKAVGHEDASTLLAMNNLANAHKNKGNYEEAEVLYRRALKGQEEALKGQGRVLGSELLSSLTTVKNLAGVLKEKGEHKEAEILYKRALDGYERSLGCGHPDTLIMACNLANLFEVKGNYVESEKLYRRALEGKEKTLGLDHFSTLSTVKSLAGLFIKIGDNEAAKALFQRAINGYGRTLGSGHPFRLDKYNDFGLLLKEKAEYEEAEVFFRRALEGYKKIHGSEHISTLTVMNNLANLLMDKEGYGEAEIAEAEQLYRRALAGLEKAFGNEDPKVIDTTYRLANLLEMNGNYDEAETLYRRVLDCDNKIFEDAYHPDTLATSERLADVLEINGKFEEAEVLFRRVLKGYTTSFGDHDKTLHAAKRLEEVILAKETHASKD